LLPCPLRLLRLELTAEVARPLEFEIRDSKLKLNLELRALGARKKGADPGQFSSDAIYTFLAKFVEKMKF
jgi:hypothetical protein